MRKLKLALLLSVLVVGMVSAQGADTSRFERIRIAKEAFLREELALTEAEAARFFPVYWTYDAQLRRGRRHHGRSHGRTQQSTVAEADALAILERRREERRKMCDLQTEAEDAYLKILSPSKVLGLQRAEREFREKLLRRIKQSRAGRRN